MNMLSDQYRRSHNRLTFVTEISVNTGYIFKRGIIKHDRKRKHYHELLELKNDIYIYSDVKKSEIELPRLSWKIIQLRESLVISNWIISHLQGSKYICRRKYIFLLQALFLEFWNWQVPSTLYSIYCPEYIHIVCDEILSFELLIIAYIKSQWIWFCFALFCYGYMMARNVFCDPFTHIL